MTDTLQPYEVYAIRYARHDLRRTSENFIGGAPDPHEDPLMPLDFFVWAIRGPNGTFVVDSGFDEAMAARRQRKILCPVGEGLRKIGIDPATVENVLITHLHYDHAGNNDRFPKARYHLDQGRVVIFAAGTGNPYITTDSAAALRASEIKAEVLLKATKVDGVFDKDPMKHADAKKIFSGELPLGR